MSIAFGFAAGHCSNVTPCSTDPTSALSGVKNKGCIGRKYNKKKAKLKLYIVSGFAAGHCSSVASCSTDPTFALSGVKYKGCIGRKYKKKKRSKDKSCP